MRKSNNKKGNKKALKIGGAVLLGLIIIGSCGNNDTEEQTKTTEQVVQEEQTQEQTQAEQEQKEAEQKAKEEQEKVNKIMDIDSENEYYTITESMWNESDDKPTLFINVYYDGDSDLAFKTDAYIRLCDIYEWVAQNYDLTQYSKVRIQFDSVLVDQYGNDVNGTILNSHITTDDLSRINWDKFINSNIKDVAEVNIFINLWD